MKPRVPSGDPIGDSGAPAAPPARVSRRRFLELLGYGSAGALGASGIGVWPAAAASEGHEAPPAGVSPDEALARLMAGNGRYAAQRARRPNQTGRRRVEVAAGQHPFAIVLGCADSRVPPEIVFDQGLGDLFVVRVAGNIADDAAVGSLEYGVDHLGAPLILVLGHEGCGAVTAAIEAVEKGGDLPGHLGAVVGPIRAAVERARGRGGDLLDNAVRANVESVVDRLKASEPVLAAAAKAGRLKIVGGRYALRSGRVDLIA